MNNRRGQNMPVHIPFMFHFPLLTIMSFLNTSLPVLFLVLFGICADAGHAKAQQAQKRVCLTNPETREAIVQHRLADAFAAMKTAGSKVSGNALATRLCLWDQDYVYEITVLRKDGRVIHVFMNARDGQVMGSQNNH